LVVQRVHEVDTDGQFRVVRHQSYAGPILLFVGIGLVLDTWVGLAICLVLPIGAYAWRITVEERMLVAGLGTAYERYREQTWRIVPGIW
jgi:protein-S-isoprenylcysteine O-methyltransferase